MPPASAPPRLYPLFADLRGRPVLVVGGGAVALRKAEALLAAGASVRVGAPRLVSGLQALAAASRVVHVAGRDRKSVGRGKGVSVRVDTGVGGILIKQTTI